MNMFASQFVRVLVNEWVNWCLDKWVCELDDKTNIRRSDGQVCSEYGAQLFIGGCAQLQRQIRNPHTQRFADGCVGSLNLQQRCEFGTCVSWLSSVRMSLWLVHIQEISHWLSALDWLQLCAYPKSRRPSWECWVHCCTHIKSEKTRDLTTGTQRWSVSEWVRKWVHVFMSEFVNEFVSSWVNEIQTCDHMRLSGLSTRLLHRCCDWRCACEPDGLRANSRHQTLPENIHSFALLKSVVDLLNSFVHAGTHYFVQ